MSTTVADLTTLRCLPGNECGGYVDRRRRSAGVAADEEQPGLLVQPKCEKLVQRGPCDFRILTEAPHGRPVDVRLGGGVTLQIGR